jgi:cyclophilin family peptidyl-prolyl cis-trans isomerase
MNEIASRRQAVQQIITASVVSVLVPSQLANAAVVQAVGSGESTCRKAGNCLEVGEWDGAVGWNWGGKNRCDPSDPLCGTDGKLRDEPLRGQPVPTPASDITYVAALQIEIGRGEVGILRLGLYGDDAPASVQQFLEFLSSEGFSVPSINDPIGSVTAPVSLKRGGVIDSIVPGITVSFGVPSQSVAYGRSRNLSRIDNFVPQNRADSTVVANDAETIRPHNVAGLVSVPRKGLGHGGTGFEQVDEAYESTFLITAGPVPSLDRNRRVIGQVLDASSMAFLERLATLPTKRGIRGVIPGQTSGPPLLKVVVRDTEISRVGPKPT